MCVCVNVYVCLCVCVYVCESKFVNFCIRLSVYVSLCVCMYKECALTCVKIGACVCLSAFWFISGVLYVRVCVGVSEGLCMFL